MSYLITYFSLFVNIFLLIFFNFVPIFNFILTIGFGIARKAYGEKKC